MGPVGPQVQSLDDVGLPDQRAAPLLAAAARRGVPLPGTFPMVLGDPNKEPSIHWNPYYGETPKMVPRNLGHPHLADFTLAA